MQGQQLDASMERLWRKRADFDARLSASRADVTNADKKLTTPPPNPAPEVSAEVTPSLPRPPTQLQASELLQQHQEQEQQRPRAAVSTGTTAKSRPSSGISTLAKRVVSSASIASPRPRHSVQSGAAVPSSPSIAAAAFSNRSIIWMSLRQA